MGTLISLSKQITPLRAPENYIFFLLNTQHTRREYNKFGAREKMPKTITAALRKRARLQISCWKYQNKLAWRTACVLIYMYI